MRLDAANVLDEVRPNVLERVFLAHSGAGDVAILIDEQFYFAEDARWFYRDGYKRMLYDGEDQPDRMSLFTGYILRSPSKSPEHEKGEEWQRKRGRCKRHHGQKEGWKQEEGWIS